MSHNATTHDFESIFEALAVRQMQRAREARSALAPRYQRGIIEPKPFCSAGHPRTPENRGRTNNECRLCRMERNRAYRERHKATDAKSK